MPEAVCQSAVRREMFIALAVNLFAKAPLGAKGEKVPLLKELVSRLCWLGYKHWAPPEP